MLLCVSVKGHLKHLFVQQAPRSSATMGPLVEIKARAWVRSNIPLKSTVGACNEQVVRAGSRFACMAGL